MISAALLLLTASQVPSGPELIWRLQVMAEEDRDARTLAGAVVRPWYEIGEVTCALAETRSDGRGVASIDLTPLAGLPPCERASAWIHASVHGAGHVVDTVGTRFGYVASARTDRLDEIWLRAGISRVGRVVDARGNPVQGARILAGDWNGQAWQEDSLQEAESDGFGTFILEGRSDSPQFVSALHGTQGTAFAPLATGAEPMLLVLEPVAVTTRGTVLTSGGRPLPGKLVPAYRRTEDPNPHPRHVGVWSDEQGAFEMQLPPGGPWEIYTDCIRGAGPAEMKVSPGARDVVLSVGQPHLRIAVVDEQGRAMSGIEPWLSPIHVTPTGPRREYWAPARPMATRGVWPGELTGTPHYLIELIHPQLFALRASCEEDACPALGETLIRIESGADLVEATLVLHPRPYAPPITVEVLDALGREVRGWSACLISTETGVPVERFTHEGVAFISCMGPVTYSPPRAPAGSYVLRVDPGDYALPIERRIELVPNEAPRFQFRSAGFGGRLVLQRREARGSLESGVTLHLRAASSGTESGPWRLARSGDDETLLKSWSPTEREGQSATSILLLPGVWKFELRSGDVALHGQGQLEIEAGAETQLRLDI